jgi:hypothetical protein
MIYVPRFMKIGSSIQKLIKGRFTDREHGDRVSLLSFFQNKESRLKTTKHGYEYNSAGM